MNKNAHNIAKEIEDPKFEELNQKYLVQARNLLHRDAESDKDVIAVRKRMLNRGFDARKGKLFAKFSDIVAGLNDQAASTLGLALQSLDDTEQNLRSLLPANPDTITSEVDTYAQDCVSSHLHTYVYNFCFRI